MFVLCIIADAAAQKVEIWWNLEKIVMNKKKFLSCKCWLSWGL